MSSRGSYSLMVDHEKKMKRKMSNRESARRSRMKRDQHMKDLSDNMFYIAKKRDEMLLKMEGIAREYTAVEMENMVLRSQKQELEKRLENAKSVYGWCEGDGQVLMSPMGWLQEPWGQHDQTSNSISLMSSTRNSHF